MPIEPDPERPFRRLRRAGGLYLADQNKVYHFVQMDQSPRNWADALLRITVGFRDQWTPKDYYAVFPKGYQERPGKAVVFITTKKLRFDEAFDPDSTVPLRSSSDPRYTLFRVGEHLVVTRGAERRWYFETPDQGKSWRIAMIEEVQRPGRFTRAKYLNDVIVAVEYPNGQEATIDYQYGKPVRIQTPFGQRAEIHRGSGGRITKVEVFRDEEGEAPLPEGGLPDPKTKKVAAKPPAKAYQYERDGEGRITRYVDPLGGSFRVVYQVDEKGELKQKVVTFQVRVINEADDSYMERRHVANSTKREWYITDSYGRLNAPRPKDEIENSVRMNLVGTRWSVVGRASGHSKRQTNVKVDKRGLPTTSVGPSGLTKILEHDEAGNPTKMVESDGKTNVSTYNELGQVTRRINARGQETLMTYDEHGRLLSRLDAGGRESVYQYDARGFPNSSAYHGNQYVFEIDDWGRIVGVTFHNGAAMRWSFNRFGDLESKTRFGSGAFREQSGSAPTETPAGDTTAFLYDKRGRIVGIQRPDGLLDQISYNPSGRLHAVIEGNGNRVRYRYDDAGRISHKQDPKRRFESWTYQPSGRIETHKFRDADQKRLTERRYDHEGKLVYERVTGDSPTKNHYDELGNLVRTDYPDGTWSEFAYDARGRLASIRGTHREPVDYRYEGSRRIAVESQPESDGDKP